MTWEEIINFYVKIMLSRLAKGSCSTWPEKGVNGPRLTAWPDSELQVVSEAPSP